eukprot:TRINITY_DN80992_c0_g1_i1.p1 TRINITY_DN80992_c0_g1~~TRINITY_DN80992_c0_g1_i1.p1  ORF type:complete len:354 (+),score=43.34 TRINITY_DN80992_c0_g1_i1:50-1063(+)
MFSVLSAGTALTSLSRLRFTLRVCSGAGVGIILLSRVKPFPIKEGSKPTQASLGRSGVELKHSSFGCTSPSSQELKKDMGLPMDAGSNFASIWVHFVAETWRREKQRKQEGKPAVDIDYFRRIWADRDCCRPEDLESDGGSGARIWAHAWKDLSPKQAFTEIYGPDTSGDFVVVERASNYLRLLQYVEERHGSLDPTMFRQFRVWWFEKILCFLQSQARLAPSCAGGQKETRYPRMTYLIIADIPIDMSMLRYFYKTFEIFKTLALLGDHYPGIAKATVFYGSGRVITMGLNTIKTFTSCRNLLYINSLMQLKHLTAFDSLPSDIGGGCSKPMHIVM